MRFIRSNSSLSSSKNKIEARYSKSEGKFIVSYDLQDVDPDTLVVYDQVQIKEILSYPGCEDVTNGVSATESALQKGSVEVESLVQLGIGDGRYYAIFLSGTSLKEICRSDVFTINDDCGDSSGGEDGEQNSNKNQNANEDICDIEVSQICQVGLGAQGRNNCEITIRWKFVDHNIPSGVELSDSDWICVIPSRLADENFYLLYSQYAFGMASGKKEGIVKLMLGGYVSLGEEYQVFYFETSNDRKLGSSHPFTIQSNELPKMGKQEREDTMIESRKYNTVSVLQYTMQSHMESVEAASNHFNPLLTIVPKRGKWEKLIEKNKQKYSNYQEEAKAELERAKSEKNLGLQSNVDDAAKAKLIEQKEDEVYSDIKTDAILTAAITRDKPFFLYLGAGISIDAPSSSPSWWKLMSDILEETFKAVPKEHQEAANKLGTSDKSRSPEEVMETYYFVLQEKLFEVFELLNEGGPNANHRIIAKMVKAGKVRSILTTNFDEFIERALDMEDVEYKVICTNDEFKEYRDGGCKGFAILKIHGTVSRPDTIVAVSNHYKLGKGFGGMKATVVHYFIQNFPTLFFGYSGWDFVHANYQEFWDTAGQNGGEQVYFIKYKGAKGGPLISNLVGKHIGRRLVIGEGIMPGVCCSMMKDTDQSGAHDVLQFYHNVNPTTKAIIQVKQKSFIQDWVKKIPIPSLLAILWIESSYLNENSKERQERIDQTKGDAESATIDKTALQAYIMQLVTEMAQGNITQEEYTRKQRRAVAEMTLEHAEVSSSVKEKLVDICLEAGQSNPLLQKGNSDELNAMLPAYMLSTAARAPLDSTPQYILDMALQYIADVLTPLYQKSKLDRRSKILYDLYYAQPTFLRLRSRDKNEVVRMIENFADLALEKKWADYDIPVQMAKKISPVITRLAFQQIDTDAIVKSQVEYIVQLNEESPSSSADQILECSFIIAASLFRQTAYRIGQIYENETMQKILQMISLDEGKRIPSSMFESVMTHLNEPVLSVIGILRVMAKKRRKGNNKSSLTPKEVLATFDLANIEALRQSLRHIGKSASSERSRESRGFYPHDPLPPSVASYLSSKAYNVLKNLKDERALNSCLGVVAALAGCTRDTKMMQIAVDRSLALTEGKVTELTPAPIPEALAALYQENGDLDSAIHYYKLSLEGIRTFVMRQKADAIVLNACLTQATFDVSEALRMAFEFSPFFSDNQQYGIVGPGRSLLVHQAEAWSTELGWKSLGEAKEGIFAIEEEADVSSQIDVDSGRRSGTKMSEGSYTTVESQKSSSFRHQKTARIARSRCIRRKKHSKCAIM